ncbi:MAG: M24 family metallopeptidase [Terriglobales bacterium]
MDYRGRLQRVLAALERKQLDAILITHLPNIRYLCGFGGSAGVLVVRAPRPVFFTDGRYTAQAHEQVQGAQIKVAQGSAISAAAKWLKGLRVRKVGIEAERMSVATRTAVAALLPESSRLRPTAGMVEELRMIKEPEEVENIRRAVLTGAALLDTAIEAVHPGVAETAVAAEIEYAARRAGCEGMSFPTIVAAGVRSSLPHGEASSQPVPARGFVVMDFGVILGAYCSDMTRTVHVGRVDGAARRVYEAVREAQQAGLDAVRPGVTVGDVDQAARRTLRRAGLAQYFTHSTGHGVGLEIHERPRLARGGTDVLRPGMVITIEPGVYIPGRYGVRIEDMAVVTEHGCDVLTPSSKELISL